jgi:hypothetical protein
MLFPKEFISQCCVEWKRTAFPGGKELGFFMYFILMTVFRGLIVGTTKISDFHKNQIFSELFTSSTVSTQSSVYCDLRFTLRIQGFD